MKTHTRIIKYFKLINNSKNKVDVGSNTYYDSNNLKKRLRQHSKT